ncbi:MAG: P-II family nitrogen regulator [Caldilinea sp.]|nr:P-II family nitrogen regulator [Caldilinea sp.]MDW8439147.1 P-II family nitrogen regulator [Caldilineaceae bacterium]
MTKKIEAIIREEALQDVKNALREIGIVGLNVHEVHGHGRQGGIELSWRGTSYQMDLLPKIQVNIVLSDHNVDKTVEAIVKAARTGKEGDGIIFIYPVEDVIRIRTGERGSDALKYKGDIDDRKMQAAR